LLKVIEVTVYALIGVYKTGKAILNSEKYYLYLKENVNLMMILFNRKEEIIRRR